MAQLTPDQFAFGGALMSVDEAVARIAATITPLAKTALLPLLSCDGLCLAEDLVAPINLPPFNNSAVDGYTVRFTDLDPAGPTRLPVTVRLAAGAAAIAPIQPGTATRIFTGAPLPEGADVVFMQEDVTLDGEVVVLPTGLKRMANARPAGEDMAAGTIALHAGRRMVPETLALAAALGLTHLTVRQRPRVAIFSTGNEVRNPGQGLGPAQLYDSNRFALASLVTRAGGEPHDLGILPDDRASLAQALRTAAASHDMIVTSGGVSTGEEDHVKGAVEDVGHLTFWRLAIKPGRPVAMGLIDGVPLIGLPGNPVAVFVTFAHVVRPIVQAMGGETPKPLLALPVRSGFAYKKKEGRREYVRVSLSRGPDGVISAQKHPRDGAGVISSLTETDGLVELPEAVTRVEPGDLVGFLDYRLLR